MRESAGLTQQRLANAIGTSQPTIARLERGSDQRLPRWDLMRRIGHALGRQLKLVFIRSDKEGELVEMERPARSRRRGDEART